MVSEAIESIISQNYRPINIAVIDDGSEDNPEEAVNKLCKDNQDDRNLEIIFLKNSKPTGPSAARNKAIKHMWEHTDVFMMLDADDRYLDGKILKSVQKYLESPEHIGIVYTDAIIENKQKNTKIHEFRQPFSKEALERECIISNTPLISKEALSKSGLYDEEMRTCEDWDLWLRITEFFVAIHIAEPLHIYSVTGKNSSDTVAQEVWQSNWSKIRQKIMQRKHANK
tara:strand:- start:54 stop:734 length:681 start_codon:yes stop_codon:yes gene_type:complete